MKKDLPGQEELDGLLEKFVSETISPGERCRLTELLTQVKEDSTREIHFVGDRLAASILLRVMKEMK